MSWIKTINYHSASGKLKKLYDRIKGPNGALDNVLTIHSLRPHTLEGHMALYKGVLHHSGNTLPKWYLEMLGTYVSMINQCHYCATHHAVGFKKNLGDDEKYDKLMTCLKLDNFSDHLESKFEEGIKYAKLLTLTPSSITKENITSLRTEELTDGEILEINQVVGYFNYVNRMVVGLGVDLEKSDIGLSPQSSDGDDWSHS